MIVFHHLMYGHEPILMDIRASGAINNSNHVDGHYIQRRKQTANWSYSLLNVYMFIKADAKNEITKKFAQY
jgi:hypothetical protein